MSFMMLILVGRASSADPDRGASASASPDNRTCRRSGAFSILICSFLKALGAWTGHRIRRIVEQAWASHNSFDIGPQRNDSGRADHHSLPRVPFASRRRRLRPYLLGEQDRLVGVSGYAVRPPQASTPRR